jgi:hypothetical protein
MQHFFDYGSWYDGSDAIVGVRYPTMYSAFYKKHKSPPNFQDMTPM